MSKAWAEDQRLHQLIESQAERTPHSIAAIFEDQQLTYCELNARANQVGHRLRRLGVGPNTLVGLCVERSLDAVVGLLGILKAGGAYMPLDPHYPRPRLAFLLEDARVPVLLTQERLIASLPGHGAQVLLLDGAGERFVDESRETLPCVTGAPDLAYVIYTSGSTGVPKGVMIPHAGIVNLLASVARVPGLVAADRVLAVASFSFDPSCLDLWLPLSVGASVEIASRSVATDGVAMRLSLERGSITLLQGTASTFRMLLDAGWRGDGRLKVLIGGEPLSRDLADRILERAGSLWNMYGPTEISIYCCAHRVLAGEAIRIGRPIANMRVYVVDEALSPVPTGELGELCIGGVGLARGYLNRPELTAEKFVSDPFVAEPGARMYRSGDLGRWHPDGTLECLGRRDFQVKIRGFRIELGEIEHALERHPSVHELVVTAREDTPGDARLVAYVVPSPAEEGGHGTLGSRLREYLGERLPAHMIPSFFVVLPALPRNPNGKLDRGALPAPATTIDEHSPAFIAPRTPVEKSLAALWSEVLRVPLVGVRENFFDLGGDSLLAARVLGRVRQSWGVEVPLRAMFEKPTIAALAEDLPVGLRQGSTPSGPPLAPVARSAAMPLSFAQRLWFLDEGYANHPINNLGFAARLRGSLSVRALEQSLQEIVRRHEALRTTFPSVEGAPRQAIASVAVWSLPVLDVPEADVHGWVQAERARPFDVAIGPLLRTTLLGLSRQDHVLVVTVHHAVCDGLSLNLLIRELNTLYAAFSAGQTSPLAELPIQFVDVAMWQALRGEEHVDYWVQRLAGPAPAPTLPVDRPGSEVPTYAGAAVPIALPGKLCTGLQTLGRREGVTLFMTLLAALNALLHRHSGQEDIVILSPLAGRTRVESEALIGAFINIVPIRTDLSGAPTVRELLARVRSVTLEAFAHQDVLPEALLDVLWHPRGVGRILRVMLVLESEALALSLGGLAVELLHVEATSSDYELMILLEETAEGLRGELRYHTDLFDRETIARLAVEYQTLLERMIADPGRRLPELAL